MATDGNSHATPASRRRVRVPAWIGEIVLVGLIYGAYELARGVHQGTVAKANHVGSTLLTWEHALYIDPEKWLTVHLDHITWLAVPASYFYATAHYIVTPVVLIWLYLRHRYTYNRGRTWLALSTMTSLIIFYLLPTTPPRLLGRGYPDVLFDMRDYGWWGGDGSAPRGLGHLTNQLAAMPSMHVGWALWCGYMIYRCAPYLWVRALGVLYPIVTTLVVLSTGNHYLLDCVAGAVTMAAGAIVTWVAYRIERRVKARLKVRRTERASAALRRAAQADGGEVATSARATSTTAKATSTTATPATAASPASAKTPTADPATATASSQASAKAPATAAGSVPVRDGSLSTNDPRAAQNSLRTTSG